MEKSQIAEFYEGRSVFITGATGFVGKALVEKLLRSCPGLDKIYILARPKKGESPEQRVDKFLDSLVNGRKLHLPFNLLNILLYCIKFFDAARKANPSYRTKVEAIQGDLGLPSLGISARDEEKLIKSINIVFHSAATLRFDEPLKCNFNNALFSNCFCLVC